MKGSVKETGSLPYHLSLQFLQHNRSEPMSLIELQQELGMPLIEVWLGLLLCQEPVPVEAAGRVL